MYGYESGVVELGNVTMMFINKFSDRRLEDSAAHFS